MTREEILQAIETERTRQDLKFGRVETRRNAPWAAILAEEVGEAARAFLENTSKEDLEDELIQVAAVAVAWIEALDRHGS